ncbi:MAG: hypothetical protein JJ932_13915 [Balneolaceae bacterium]|nr:hypothetical protein [Balneolaceae bacterium]MBO6648882.1 hypothetical protein [Balneolaceae bacterium]
MSNIRSNFFWFLILLGINGVLLQNSFAQNSSASASSDSLTVGEIFTISLKLQLDQPYDKIVFPDSSAFPPILELLNTQQFRVTDFADSVLYRLQFFGNTDITLPPFRILLINARDTNAVFTNPIALYFKTVLPSEDADLKPLKPIFDISGFPWALAIILLALLLAAALAYYTWRKKADKEPVQEEVTFEPFVSPLTELETTLTYLKQEYDLAATKDYKYFYTSLSDSIRAYFEELYNIPALESTSRELFRFLDAFGVDHEMIKSTRLVLNRSDMVKFAKYTPTLDDAWTCYQYAIDFLDRARLVDASRISRKKSNYEAQFKNDETGSDETEETQKETE